MGGTGTSGRVGILHQGQRVAGAGAPSQDFPVAAGRLLETHDAAGATVPGQVRHAAGRLRPARVQVETLVRRRRAGVDEVPEAVQESVRLSPADASALFPRRPRLPSHHRLRQ